MSKYLALGVILLLIGIIQIHTTPCTITLQTHRECDFEDSSAYMFMNRLAHIYRNSSIRFNSYIIRYDPADPKIYPRIVIKYDKNEIKYDSGIDYKEMDYWISYACFHQIPECDYKHTDLNIEQYALISKAVTKKDKEDFISLIGFLLNRPIRKLCHVPKHMLDSKNLTSEGRFRSVEQFLNLTFGSKPFYQVLNLNTINYLQKNNHKIGVILIFDVLRPQQSEIAQLFYHNTKNIFEQEPPNHLFFTYTHYDWVYGKSLLMHLDGKVNLKRLPMLVAIKYKVSKHANQQDQFLYSTQFKIEKIEPFGENYKNWLIKLVKMVGNPTKYGLISPQKQCFVNKITITRLLSNTNNILASIATMKYLMDVSQQKDYYTNLIHKALQQLVSSSSCKRGYAQKQAGGILTDESYIGYQLKMKFEKLEVIQSQFNYLPLIKLCVAGRNQMYFESPQQLFTLMIQDGLIARRGQAKVVSNDSEKFGDL